MSSSSEFPKQGSSTSSLSSDVPPIPLCLQLENTLPNQQYSTTFGLKTILGVPLGNTVESHNVEVDPSRPTPPLVTKMLKNISDNLKDTCNKARYMFLLEFNCLELNTFYSSYIHIYD